jgi:acyl carrier protein
MTEVEVYQGLTQIFRELFPRTKVALSASLTARDVVGWDSMKQVELLMSAEELFDIKFKSKDVENLAAIGDLVAAILLRRGEG